MAKSVHNDVLDAALDEIATCTRMDVCSAEPTTLAEATSTFTLANFTLTAGTAGADYAIADGDVSGRKLTVAAQAGATASATGNGTHIALSDGTSLLYVTTCTSQSITTGNTVNTNAYDIEVADPS